MNQQTNQPLVYIILPVYNWWEFFFQQLYTIKSQIYDNRHMIVINDGSTDDTVSNLENFIIRYNLTKKITVISQKNTWQYAACWVWLWKVKELCKWKYEWKYIAYCDADDLWTDNKLLDQVTFMENNSNCDLSYHDCWLTNEYNEIIWFSSLYYFSNFGKRIDAKKFFDVCMGPCAISTTMMFKAKRIDRIIPVYPKFSQDRWIMLVLSWWDAKICKINEKYAFYRRSKKSSLALKKKNQTVVDWHNTYLNALKFLIWRIEKSNNKTLTYMIKYNELKISMIKKNKSLLYRLFKLLIKFPKILHYLIKNFFLSRKDYIHFINESKSLLKLKN